jgi:hypothetical protein
MQYYQHVALGAFHPVFCEDFCVRQTLGDEHGNDLSGHLIEE